MVVLSSSGHRLGNLDLDDLHYTKGREYNQWQAYGASKVANILFAKELYARGEGKYVTASVHPGKSALLHVAGDGGYSFGLVVLQVRSARVYRWELARSSSSYCFVDCTGTYRKDHLVAATLMRLIVQVSRNGA